MPNKATWLFNGDSTKSGKTWGFSESWYSGLSDDALITAMDNVSAIRRQILAYDCQIVGYRIGQPNGRSYVVRKSFAPPNANDYSNIPVDAAMCQVGVVGAPAIKRFWLHDLPDDWIERTEIVAGRVAAIRNVVDAYTVFGFQVRFQNQAAVTSDIFSIDALGVVVTVQAHGLVANQQVSFLKCRDVNNKAIRGQYIVTNVASPTVFTVGHWPGNVVGRRGKVRLTQYQFGAALSLLDRGVVLGGSRKVGRPFFQSRGRAPARR